MVKGTTSMGGFTKKERKKEKQYRLREN